MSFMPHLNMCTFVINGDWCRFYYGAVEKFAAKLLGENINNMCQHYQVSYRQKIA